LLHSPWSYYNMHFNYTVFIYCFANMKGLII
jgi:hypothetical protein